MLALHLLARRFLTRPRAPRIPAHAARKPPPGYPRIAAAFSRSPATFRGASTATFLEADGVAEAALYARAKERGVAERLASEIGVGLALGSCLGQTEDVREGPEICRNSPRHTHRLHTACRNTPLIFRHEFAPPLQGSILSGVGLAHCCSARPPRPATDVRITSE